MNRLGLSLVIQLSLATGMAGLLWPEKLKPVFDLLMYPWPSSYRSLRANCIAAIALSVLLFFCLSPTH